MENQEDVVSFAVEDGIAWVNFNRPAKRNAMSPTLNRRMMEVLDELEFRDDVGVLVLSGEGTAWSAGMDLKEYFRETEATACAACASRSAKAMAGSAACAGIKSSPSPWSMLVLWRRFRPPVCLRPRHLRR